MSVVGSEPKLERFKRYRVGFVLWNGFFTCIFHRWLIMFQLFEGPPVGGISPFVIEGEHTSILCNNSSKLKMISRQQQQAGCFI